CCGMRITPRGITATGLPADYIDYVFHSETQSVELTCSIGRQVERRHESIALSHSDRGVSHSSWRPRKLGYSRSVFKERWLPIHRGKEVTVGRRHSSWTHFPSSTLSSHR